MLEYHPWEVVYDAEVSLPRGNTMYLVNIPWIAAIDAQGLLRTGEVLAMLAIREIERPNPQENIESLKNGKYDPPLVRFHCSGCNNSWDAWVSEDGELEDKWSVICTIGSCKRRGMPATLLKEDMSA